MILRQLPLIGFLFLSLFTYGQTYENSDYYLIDSLSFDEISSSDSVLVVTNMVDYHAATHDTSKLHALNNIVNLMISDKWGAYAKYMLDMNKALLNKEGNTSEEHDFYQKMYAGSLSNYGMYISHHGDNEGAIALYLEGLEIAKAIQNYAGMSATYNNLAFQYEQIGRTQEALEYHHISLRIDLALEDTAGITSSYNNLGLLYHNLGELDLAHDNYLKCYDYLKEGKDLLRLAITCGNIGASYGNRNQVDSAIFYLRKALTIQEETGDKLGMSISLGSIADNYVDMERYDSALYYYNQSIATSTAIEYKRGLSINENGLGYMHYKLGDYPLATTHTLKGLELAQEVGLIQETASAANILYKIYNAQGLHKKALEMHVLHVEMRDSSDNVENRSLAIKTELNQRHYQEALADSIANVQEKEMLVFKHQEEKAQEKQRTLFLGILFGLALLFAGFIFNRFRLTRKQKEIIEEQKETVDLAYEQLAAKNKEITDSITYAKRIQSAILPPDKVVKNYVEKSFIYYLPKDIVAGDFYWFENSSDTILFAAADCTGHGVPGAMVSVVCHNALNRSVREYGLRDPGMILDKTREIVVREFEKSEEQVKDGMDIALCALQGNKLEFAGAYNPLWVVRKGELTPENLQVSGAIVKTFNALHSTLFEIRADKQPVGKFDSNLPFSTKTITLKPGDRIYVFSDGYVDQFGGEKGKKLKAKGFKTLLLSIQDKTMTEQHAIVRDAFEDWKGDFDQVDDVCLIGIEI